MISIRCGGLRLVTVPEGGAPLRAALTVILETSQECGAVWRVQRSPRTREREREMGVLSGGLVVPAHARVASDSVFFMSSGGQLGCNSTAAWGPARRWLLWCGGACLPLRYLRRVSLQWFSLLV
jgi:hypothetical protein